MPTTPHDKPLTPSQRKLINAGGEIYQDAPTDQDKAFLARQLVQATLPHTDPGDVPVWSRKNGNVTLTIQQGYDDDTGKPTGHPYGTIPRLLMYWMTTEALRTKSRKLQLGDNLASFMEQIGLNPNSGGGKRGDAARLKEQMRRLFDARVSFSTTLQDDDAIGKRKRRMQIATETVYWWHPKDPHQRAFWGSYVELDYDFYEAITASPVPVDIRALRAIKRSPLALDLYSLLTYQAFRASRTGDAKFLSWNQLETALGSSYADTADLKRAIKDALRKIRAVYPRLVIGDRVGGLEVLPDSLPAIASK